MSKKKPKRRSDDELDLSLWAAELCRKHNLTSEINPGKQQLIINARRRAAIPPYRMLPPLR